MTASIIIPAFNRPEPLRYTLRSAAAAAAALGEPAELIVVDDGSEPPLREQLGDFDCGAPIVWIRQANQGSIAGRMRGLRAAGGDLVLFLDSDDLVAPAKLRRHADVLKATGADVAYDDMATAALGPGYAATYAAGARLDAAADSAALFLKVQPAPHGPVYRRSYLLRALAPPLVPMDRRMDPAGDVWLYYNLCVHPARIAKIDEPLTAVGPHQEERFSRHWEKLGVAALRIMTAFVDRCPGTPDTLRARTLAGEVAFHSWRRLPGGFHAGYGDALLGLWRRAPKGPVGNLGERRFGQLARLIGPEPAGRLLRALRRNPYSACRTLSGEEYDRLFADFGRP